jgi:transcriptional regulator with XRE-family HTH domain
MSNKAICVILSDMRPNPQRGAKLKAARLEAKLSREKAGKLLGVHRNSINNWERGKMPSEDARHKLLELYEGLEGDLFPDPLAEFEESVLAELTDLRKRLT